MNTSLFRPADYVETSTGNVAMALAIGGLLLIAVLVLLLASWRIVVTAVAAIVASLAVAGTILVVRDVTLNVMLLAGLVMAIGIVVDDAVTDVHQIAERLRARAESGAPAWRRVLDASLAVRSSLLFATMIVIAAVVPGFFLDGQAGAFLPPVLVSYLLAVGASMLVALVLTPGLALMLLSKPSGPQESPVLRWIKRRHESSVTRAVRRPRWAYGAMGVALVAGLVTFPLLDRDTSVSLKENDLLVRWDAAPGTSLPAMNDVTTQVVDELSAIPGVGTVGAHVGRAIHSDQIVNVNSGEIWLNLDGSADHDEAVASIERVLSSHEELTHRVTTYPEQRIADILSGRDRDVVVRVYGANAETLEAKAEEIQGALSGSRGSSGRRSRPSRASRRSRSRWTSSAPSSSGEAGRRASCGGDPPGRPARGQPLRGAEGLRRGRVGLPRHPAVDRRRGAAADRHACRRPRPPEPGRRRSSRGEPDRAPARGRVQLPRRQRRHRGSRRRRRARGRRHSDRRRGVPIGAPAEVRGAATDPDASSSSVLAVAITAALAIFLLLQAAFTSWRLAILAFAALTVALVGGILAALIAGGTIGLGAFAGMLAVLGLAGRSVVLMIRHYQYLERDGGETFGDELVLRGTQERLLPTVVTALGTIVAFAPLLVMGDVAGMKIVRPMAIVMIGGLVASTLLVLFVLPPLYRMQGFVAKRDAVADELIVLPETPVEVEPVTGG